MAVKKQILTTLLLGLLISPAVASNNLVQLDLKKTSNDALNVTLVTSETYADNVLVRKKSDNKYVILAPKVTSSGFKNSSLYGVHDIVKGIDVKTVNDTNGGYTKITLITAKPISIKTGTLKSTPLTSEQKEYNTILAQANAARNNISHKAESPKPKTKITTNKVSTKFTTNNTKPKSAKETVQIQKQVQEKKPKISLTEVSPPKIAQSPKPANVGSNNNVPTTLPAPVEKNVTNDLKDISQLSDKITPVKHKQALKPFIKKVIKKTVSLGKILIPSILLLCLIPLLIRRRKDGKNKFSWKEIYKLYLEKEATPIEKYAFVKPNTVETKRKELEKMVSSDNGNGTLSAGKSINEEDTISKTIKFKAFDNPILSLRMSDRNNRFKKSVNKTTSAEQNNVELGNSALHTNPRSLKDANLKVSDVNSDYVMSSVEEYFADEIDGLTVKSSFDIDKNRSFYLVNKDGKNSLVGKVNDEIFVLKNFKSDSTNSLQVRQDEENVYMVKAGKFKSLVEVDDKKMDVLIEL